MRMAIAVRMSEICIFNEEKTMISACLAYPVCAFFSF